MPNDDVSEIISRIGAESEQEKEAWRKIIEGISTVVFCQLKRQVEKRPGFYGALSDADIKERLKDNMITWMLETTATINRIRQKLDYGKV